MKKKEVLYLKIYNDLKSKIESGFYKTGEQIPSEKELCEEYSVSRITSKKALNMLNEDKIITRKGGLGSYAGNINLTNLNEYKKIGVMLQGINSSFGLNFIYEIDIQANRNGYKLLYAFSENSQEREVDNLRFLMDQNVEGIIVMPCLGKYYNPEIMRLAISGYPIIFFDRNLYGVPAHFVGTNHKEASEDLTNFLLSKGHKSIGLITRDTTTFSNRERYDGYLSSCKNHENVDSITNVFELSHVTKDFYKAFDKIITDYPYITGYVVTEYAYAIALKKALINRNANLSEIEIVCFDSVYFDCVDIYSKEVDFTHVKQNEKELAKQCIETIIRLINKDSDGLNMNNYVKADLIEL